MADIVLDYIAVGLDVQSDRGLAFRHSQVPELNQLMLPFLSLVSVSEIERNPTVKSEIETLGTGHVTGLMFNYPVHQAADILFCHGNLVPGGRDQLPHVEITRKIARRSTRPTARAGATSRSRCCCSARRRCCSAPTARRWARAPATRSSSGTTRRRRRQC